MTGKPLMKIKREETKESVKSLVLLSGMTATKIAQELHISERTVYRYISQIYNEIKEKLKQGPDIINDVILNDLRTREEAWKRYFKIASDTDKLRALREVSNANKELADKCMRWGITPEKPKEVMLEGTAPGMISIYEIRRLFNEPIENKEDKDGKVLPK